MSFEIALVTLTAPAIDYADQHNLLKPNYRFILFGLWWEVEQSLSDDLTVRVLLDPLDSSIEDPCVQTWQMQFRQPRRQEMLAIEVVKEWLAPFFPHLL